MNVIETHGLRKVFRTRRGAVEAVRSVDLSVQADEGATGRENLLLQGRLYGLGKKEAQARAEVLISTLQLHTFAGRVVKIYSGGQWRRLDLALGMVHRPRLLFLEEPTTGLDPQSRSALWEEVRRLRDGGTTVFLTTHYMDEADALCDRLAIMDHGKIVAEGAPEALKREVSGDVVTLDLQAHNGAFRRAGELLRTQPFVRELGEEVGEGLRLYVERGEEALPAILRLLDAAGLRTRAVSHGE